MPKLFSILLISIYYLLVPIKLCLANTDPKYATTSATATIPTSTPTTNDTTPPSTPILIAPIDGSVTGDNTPEFIWRQSSDPNGNVVIYTFYLDGVARFLGVSNSGNSSGSGYTARLEGIELKLIPTSGLSDGIHEWYVVANDLSGNTTRSTTWRFTIDTTPPTITITDVDIYHNLSLDSTHPEDFVDLIFDISGPKDVYLTIHTEPWSSVSLQFYDAPTNTLFAQSSWKVNASGVIYPYTHLALGRYIVRVSAFDQGGNSVALPDFLLNVTQAQITVPLPPLPGLPPSYSLPYTPYSIPSLPATIAKIESRLPLFTIIGSLLAIAILLLLILIWKRKYNLILLNVKGLPLENTKVYHSIPDTRRRFTRVVMSRHEPVSYDLVTSDRGRLYIRHLGRYSTLTIKTDTKIYILSLSAKRKLYALVLD